MIRFDKHELYRRFDKSDILIILGVFLTGFFLAFTVTNYYRVKKEKLEQINQKFQGLKGEYEKIEKSLKRYIKWRVRVKFAEKIYYVFLLALGFLFYKSPALFAVAFNQNPHITLPVFCSLFLIIHFSNTYLEKQE